MFRVRVSHLEAFRRLVAEDFGDGEAELVEDVRAWQQGREREGCSWQMAAGTAWHSVLANDADACCYGDEWASGQYRFRSKDVYAALDHQGPGLREVTVRRTFDTRHGPVEVKGTADHVHGLTIRDAKTKFGTPSAADYDLSLQWGWYLYLFDAQCFVYDLFHMKDPDDAGLCVLRDVVSFRLWRYPAMERDLLAWLGRFTDWAESRGITGRAAAATSAT